MTIKFYTTGCEYGCFSNFSSHGFEIDGLYYPTSEHYFQAMKFEGTHHAEIVRSASTPAQAAKKGRDRKRPLRSDWEDIKDDVMRRAVRAKFTTHDEIRDILLGTGEQTLIEDAPGDYYWGCGKNGTGKNRLGEILMELRAELAAQ